jgi:hypothetical protein
LKVREASALPFLVWEEKKSQKRKKGTKAKEKEAQDTKKKVKIYQFFYRYSHHVSVALLQLQYDHITDTHAWSVVNMNISHPVLKHSVLEVCRTASSPLKRRRKKKLGKVPSKRVKRRPSHPWI